MITPQNGSHSGAKAIASSVWAPSSASPARISRATIICWTQKLPRLSRKFFVLPENNYLVFGGPWTEAQKTLFAKDAADVKPGMQPIIPLVGTCADEQDLDAWPSGKLDPEIYRAAIRDRFRAIAEAETSGKLPWSLLGRICVASFQYQVGDYVIDLINTSLRDAKLG